MISRWTNECFSPRFNRVSSLKERFTEDLKFRRWTRGNFQVLRVHCEIRRNFSTDLIIYSAPVPGFKGRGNPIDFLSNFLPRLREESFATRETATRGQIISRNSPSWKIIVITIIETVGFEFTWNFGRTLNAFSWRIENRGVGKFIRGRFTWKLR